MNRLYISKKTFLWFNHHFDFQQLSNNIIEVLKINNSLHLFMTYTFKFIAGCTLTHLFSISDKPTCYAKHWCETREEKYRYIFWSKIIHANKNKDLDFISCFLICSVLLKFIFMMFFLEKSSILSLLHIKC